MPPTETPEARRHALAFNAVGAALRPYGEYLRLSIREDIARSVVAALDGAQPATPAVCGCACPACQEGRCENDTPAPSPKPLTQDSTGWAWLCHLCPLGGDGHWSRRGANRARDRHLDTHGGFHA